MEQGYISLNEFMRRNRIGYEVALQMIENKKVEYRRTSGGRYKIKVGGDTVSIEQYEKVLQEKEKYKTIVETIYATAKTVASER